ncbi:MAG: DNA recombination protein RmuC [Anaerohalosphaeraceae bacterium]|nr:DNA recombination protein RmuC [Anaerohalosphaeraceae bacterium]
MMEIIVVLAVLAVLASVVWLLLKISASSGAVGNLQTQLESLKVAQDRLSDTLGKSLQSGQETVNKNLQFHAETLTKLGNQLGDLQRSNQHMTALGADVRRLHNIFASPKLRGGFGEWSLENVLKKVLPIESFTLQYHYKDGRAVDALIKMPDYSVPVDAKFPLSNFEKAQQAENENDVAKFVKEFRKDVKKHIDKIADSYIRPAEGTIDFALMYIPAENVYYETIVKAGGDAKSIQDYAMEKKVIAVSPNLLYIYLMTIVMGLHGLKIEAAAAEIRQNLGKLNASFADFISSWDTLGGHLRNSNGKYDEAQKKLDRLVMQLEQIKEQDADTCSEDKREG